MDSIKALAQQIIDITEEDEDQDELREEFDGFFILAVDEDGDENEVPVCWFSDEDDAKTWASESSGTFKVKPGSIVTG